MERPGKTRLLQEEALERPAEGAHPVVCLGPKTPVYWWGLGTLSCHKAACFWL